MGSGVGSMPLLTNQDGWKGQNVGGSESVVSEMEWGVEREK